MFTSEGVFHDSKDLTFSDGMFAFDPDFSLPAVKGFLF